MYLEEVCLARESSNAAAWVFFSCSRVVSSPSGRSAPLARRPASQQAKRQRLIANTQIRPRPIFCIKHTHGRVRSISIVHGLASAVDRNQLHQTGVGRWSLATAGISGDTIGCSSFYSWRHCNINRSSNSSKLIYDALRRGGGKLTVSDWRDRRVAWWVGW